MRRPVAAPLCGQVFFYQSELPYDAAPPAWPHAGYNVSAARHTAVGVGVYSYFFSPVAARSHVQTSLIGTRWDRPERQPRLVALGPPDLGQPGTLLWSGAGEACLAPFFAGSRLRCSKQVHNGIVAANRSGSVHFVQPFTRKLDGGGAITHVINGRGGTVSTAGQGSSVCS